MLYVRHRARQPPDERHPLGHGRELYFWAFVVALLIFTGGAGMSIYEGIVHIRAGEMPTRPLVNYAVLGLSFVFESISLSFAVCEFNRRKEPGTGWFEAVEQSKDPTVFIVLMEDTAALAGLIVAAAFIGLALLTGNPLWDGLGSIVIGLILAAVAVILARECKKLLIGEEARPALQERLRATAQHHSGVCVVNDAITVHLGPQDVIAMMNLDFQDDLPLSEVERIIASLGERKQPLFVALNKVDLVKKPALLGLSADVTARLDPQSVFMVSATDGGGVPDLKAALADAVPVGPWLYPDDEVSDATDRMIAAELTREQVTEAYFGLRGPSAAAAAPVERSEPPV